MVYKMFTAFMIWETIVCGAHVMLDLYLQPDRREVRVLVHTEPAIYKDAKFRRAAGILGKSTRLRCRARGVPEVKFSWHFSGSTVVIQNNAQYTIISDSKNYPDYEVCPPLLLLSLQLLFECSFF